MRNTRLSSKKRTQKLKDRFTVAAVFVLLLLQGCVHRYGYIVSNETEEASRSLASNSEKNACVGMSLEELKQFKNMSLSTKGITQSMDWLGDLAHEFGIDEEVYQTDRMTLSNFDEKGKGIDFRKVAIFSESLVGACNQVREGLAVTVKVNPKKNPVQFKKVAALCGIADAARTGTELRHPYKPRNWGPSEAEPIHIQEWIFEENKIYDSKLAQYASPMEVLNQCDAFKNIHVVEDGIEKLFICSAAFDFSMKQYDANTRTYSQETSGDKAGTYKIKKLTKKTGDCFDAYLTEAVKIDKLGFPIPPKAPESLNDSPKKQSPQNPNTNPENKTAPDSKDNTKTAPNPKDLADLKKTYPKFKTLDPSDINRYPNPKELEKVIENEYFEYKYQVVKHMAVNLAHGYMVAALQRNFESPSQYNRNLGDLTSGDLNQGCAYPRLRDELNLMLSGEYITEENSALFAPNGIKIIPYATNFNKANFNPSFSLPLKQMMEQGNAMLDKQADATLSLSSRFQTKKEIAEQKGKQMVEAAYQISKLRQLVSLLNIDFGGQELEMITLPDWFGTIPIVPGTVSIPIPVLHFYAGAPVGFNWHQYPEQQCSVFSTAFDSEIQVTDKLLTQSDRAISGLIKNPEFKNAAFCANNPSCAQPDAFANYIWNSDPQMIAMGGKVTLNRWCGRKSKAIASLIAMESQIIQLYPALGYLDSNNKPYYETIVANHSLTKMVSQLVKNLDKKKNEKSNFTLKEEAAALEFAEKTLPKMQQDLKKFLSQLCLDLDQFNSATAYMTFLNKGIMDSFDYCTSISKPQEIKAGVSCYDRAQLMEARMAKEAAQWREDVEAPKKYMEIFTTTVDIGMDSLYLFSLVSGSIGPSASSKQGLAGGAIGALFSIAQMSFTDWYSRHYLDQFSNSNKAIAAMGIDGVNGYLDRFKEQLESKKNSLNFGKAFEAFVNGAVMGGFLSGETDTTGVGVRKMENNYFKTELANRIKSSIDKDSDGKPSINKIRFENDVRKWLADEVKKDPKKLTLINLKSANPSIDIHFDLMLSKSALDFGHTLDQMKSTLVGKKPESLSEQDQILVNSNASAESIEHAISSLSGDLQSEYRARIKEVLSSNKLSEIAKREKAGDLIRDLCIEFMLCGEARRLGCPL